MLELGRHLASPLEYECPDKPDMMKRSTSPSLVDASSDHMVGRIFVLPFRLCTVIDVNILIHCEKGQIVWTLPHYTLALSLDDSLCTASRWTSLSHCVIPKEPNNCGGKTSFTEIQVYFAALGVQAGLEESGEHRLSHVYQDRGA